MERIAGMTAGVLSVNPNTMYPLLRELERRGLIEGSWEHPERRTRRYYSLTDEGRAEYERLVEEVRPFLDSVRPRSTRSCARCTASEDGDAPRREVRLAPEAALGLWTDLARWPTFVEGFARVVEVDPGWPGEGSRVIWDSIPAGRGRVTEKVVENAAGDSRRWCSRTVSPAGRRCGRSRAKAAPAWSWRWSTRSRLRTARPARRRDLHPARAARLAAPHDPRFAVEAEEEAGLR